MDVGKSIMDYTWNNFFVYLFIYLFYKSSIASFSYTAIENVLQTTIIKISKL